MIKRIVILIVTFLLMLFTSVCFAGQLGQNSYGIYYVEDDGRFAKSKWVTIDVDADGSEEYYYFDANGFLIVNTTTPDGYQVNEKGQWIKDGKVQKKSLQKPKGDVGSSLSGIYNNTMDAYNKGLDAGQKAVEAGIDAGAKAVEAGIDAVGDMYGGILKGAANEYKKEYSKAVDDYKKEYSKAMNEYKNEFNNAMKSYSNSLGNIFKGLY